MAGRFFWASTSDYIGRKNTYFCFFALGTVLYCTVPWTGSIGSVSLFVLCFVIIMSMYGGGFATVPAYLKDMFGTRYVGAIHGWLITAWSAAGVFGPVLVNYIRQYQIDSGVPKAQAYNVTMYIMAALLVIGFICNLMIKAVHHRFHMKPDHEAITGADGGRRGRRTGWSLRRGPWQTKIKRLEPRAAHPRLGLRRHPIGLGRAANAAKCDEAVPVAASSSEMQRRGLKAAPFF